MKTITDVSNSAKEYSEVLKEERAKRIEWWRVLRILKDEYSNILDKVAGQFDMDDFDTYIEVNHGVKIVYDQNGNITGSYEIVDKNKHLILLMRYGT